MIEWGDGVFGAEAAARHYFGMSARALGPRRPRASRRWCPTRASTTATAPRPGSRGRPRSSSRAWTRRRCPERRDTAGTRRRAGRGLEYRRPSRPADSIPSADIRDRHAAGTPRRGVQAARQAALWRSSSPRRADEVRLAIAVHSRTSRSCRRGRACTRPTSPTSSRACRSRNASVVWGLVRSDRDGEILLEVSDAVRDTLLADMDIAEIVAATQNLDADEIADLAPDLPDEVVQDIIEAQDVDERAQLQSALSYPEGTRRRAHGLRGGEHPRGRDLRGGAALPAPLRRAARPDRCALRGRPRRPPARHPSAEPAAGERPGRRGRRASSIARSCPSPPTATPTRPRRRSSATTSSARRSSTADGRVIGARHGRRGARFRARAPGSRRNSRKVGLREEEDIFSQRLGVAPRTAGPGSRSTSAPPSSPRGWWAPSRARSRSSPRSPR